MANQTKIFSFPPSVLDSAIRRQTDYVFDRAAFARACEASPEFMEYVNMLAASLNARNGAPEIIATAISLGVEIGMALAEERRSLTQ